MNKRGEYQRRSNQVDNYRQNNSHGNQPNKSGQNQQSSQQQGNYPARNQKGYHEQGTRRESGYFRNFNRENRDGYQRQGNQYYNNGHRYNNRIRAEETIDDIKSDISRIEKEIELELKEIRSLRLGM